MNLNTALGQLADVIAATPDFNELRNLRRQIYQDNKLGALVTQFEAKQKMLYSQQISQNKAQQLMNELDKEYNSLTAFPLVSKYFAVQERVGQLVGSLMDSLNAELDKRIAYQ